MHPLSSSPLQFGSFNIREKQPNNLFANTSILIPLSPLHLMVNPVQIFQYTGNSPKNMQCSMRCICRESIYRIKRNPPHLAALPHHKHIVKATLSIRFECFLIKKNSRVSHLKRINREYFYSDDNFVSTRIDLAPRFWLVST